MNNLLEVIDANKTHMSDQAYMELMQTLQSIKERNDAKDNIYRVEITKIYHAITEDGIEQRHEDESHIIELNKKQYERVSSTIRGDGILFFDPHSYDISWSYEHRLTVRLKDLTVVTSCCDYINGFETLENELIDITLPITYLMKKIEPYVPEDEVPSSL